MKASPPTPPPLPPPHPHPVIPLHTHLYPYPGVYVLPSRERLRVWHGAVFVRRSLYGTGESDKIMYIVYISCIHIYLFICTYYIYACIYAWIYIMWMVCVDPPPCVSLRLCMRSHATQNETDPPHHHHTHPFITPPKPPDHHAPSGIFKFRLELPLAYNDQGTRPAVAFVGPKPFHPLVHPEVRTWGASCVIRIYIYIHNVHTPQQTNTNKNPHITTNKHKPTQTQTSRQTDTDRIHSPHKPHKKTRTHTHRRASWS